MAALQIQVNGKGLIPRGFGIAPRKELIKTSDLSFINLCLNTSGLKLKYLNPSNNKLEDLTRQNLMKVWRNYADYRPAVAPTPTIAPHVPEEPKAQAPVKEPEKVEEPEKIDEPIPAEAPVEKADESVVEEPKVEEPQVEEPATNNTGSIKPVISNNNNGGKHNNNNKNKR